MKYNPEDGFPYYFDLVTNSNCTSLYHTSSTIAFLRTITGERAVYRYAPIKWRIKQIIGHITGHERIKMFRAFLLSRSVPVQLWGYDQNLLVDNSCYS